MFMVCNIIAILLNDGDFNENFPILRESFKETYHNMNQYSKDLYEKLKQM